MLRKNDKIEYHGCGDGGVYEWHCPNRGCRYFSRTILKVTTKVNRFAHRRQCEHKR